MRNQKHLFSLQEDIHYLNCAYKAPLLKSCEVAATKALKDDRNPIGRTPEHFFKDLGIIKSEFSKIVKCNPSQVAIIPSSSYGIASALKNIHCQPGQHAITIKDEFPSDYLALHKWCANHKAELRVISAEAINGRVGEAWNRSILESITEDTALVIMSSVHWMNGIKFNLEEIGAKCKAVGAKFVVDGTQSVGALQIDVNKFNIDALICAAYKWLFGPYSTGVAFYGDAFNGGEPIEESWMNRTNAADFAKLTNYDLNYTPDAGRYNVGQTSNFILAPMLKSSLIQINTWGVEQIELYCSQLVRPLFDYLNKLGLTIEDDAFRTNHLFGLPMPKDVSSDRLKANFAKNNIYVSVRGQSLRISVNVFNTEQDISKLIEVIEASRVTA